MRLIRQFIQNEARYYNALTSDAKKLIKSIFLYDIISPLLGLFVNAFLWRETHNIQIVAIYNLILYIGVVMGFYLNGILLRKYTTSILYVFGIVIQGVSVFLLIFITKTDYGTTSLFGLLFGIAGGVFWANRNLMTLKTTQSNNRIYFSSIESNSGTLTDIIIPICTGWFIVLGEAIHLYSSLEAYKYLAFIMILIIVIIGYILKTLSVSIPPPSALILSSVDSRWNKFRLFEFVLGLMSGISSFVPVLMILTLVGKENALGSIQSLSAIFTMIVVYILAKSLKTKHRVQLLGISVLLSVIGALTFSFTYSPFGVYVFYAIFAVAAPLSWIAINSLNYDLIDEDEQKSIHYAYLCDQEIYLNGGRITAIFAFIFISVFSNNLAIRFTPLIFACSQILLLFIANRLERNTGKLPSVNLVGCQEVF